MASSPRRSPSPITAGSATKCIKSVARVEGGGDAFIQAFQKRSADLDIEIMPATHITECVDVHNRRVGRFVLNTGEEVSCDHCIFTIHPREILKILPREHLTKAFVERVTDFEPSVGIFSLYGVVETDDSWTDREDDFAPSILSLFPTSDLDKLIDPRSRGDQALVIMRSLEKTGGKAYEVVNACEVSFVEHFQQVEGFETGQASRRVPGVQGAARREDQGADRQRLPGVSGFVQGDGCGVPLDLQGLSEFPRRVGVRCETEDRAIQSLWQASTAKHLCRWAERSIARSGRGDDVLVHRGTEDPGKRGLR